MIVSKFGKQIFLFFIFFPTGILSSEYKIAVIGTGYVGLVTGAGLAEIGHAITCVDIDQKKIDQLRAGFIPIYEPGLDKLVEKNVLENRLFFTTDIVNTIIENDILFIAVGTPMSDDGQADMRYVYSVIESIAQHIKGYKIIVTKSTVPVGTEKK